MRNPRKTPTKRSRQARRALVAFLVATGPSVTAEGPMSGGMRLMPPLPLQQTANTDQIKSNPFCETGSTHESEPISLASGDKLPSIRLMPIGAAIGLQSVEGGRVPLARPPVMTIEPVMQPRIRNNPLIGSAHHSNSNLVDAVIENDGSAPSPPTPNSFVDTAVNQPAIDHKSQTGSSIILVPPKPLVPMAVVTPQVIPHPALRAETIPTYVDATLEVSPPADPAIASPVSANPAPHEAPVIVYESGDSFSFSLTDQSSSNENSKTSASNPAPIGQPAESIKFERKRIEYHVEGANVVSEVMPKNSQPNTMKESSLASDSGAAKPLVGVAEDIKLAPVDSGDGLGAENEPFEDDFAGELPALPGRSPVRSGQANIAMTDAESEAPIGLDVVEPIRLDAVAITEDFESAPLQPIDSVVGNNEQAPISIHRSRPMVAGIVEPKPAKAKRYRPPVAVTRVPIELSSNSTQSMVRPAAPVHTVQAPVLTPTAPRDHVKLTPLYMSRAQVRSLTLGGEVRRVEIADEEICQAFASGPNQLKLIGTGNGVTRLVVWADTDDKVQPTRMRAFEIHVNDTVEATGTGVGDKAQILNHSIQKTFPKCDVRVRLQHGKLIASGQCDSEESARQIMRMVRKTCLLPVQDELVVR